MRKWSWCVIVLFLVGCEEGEYKEINSCIQEKLVRFGEGELSIEKGEFLELNYRVKTDYADSKAFENSVFLSDYEIGAFGSQEFSKALQRKTTGDSLNYKLCYSEIKGMVLDEFSRMNESLHDTDLVYLDIGVGLCMTAESYLEFRAEQVRIGLVEEMEHIEKYISEKNLESRLTRKGDLHYMKLKDYGSEKVRVGDDLSLAYTCSFLDGEVFDEVTADDPLYINLGTPGQVVQGFESVLKEIGEKEEAMVIIPSYLAFGEGGSSNGRVPEKTPIIITVTILEKLN